MKWACEVGVAFTFPHYMRCRQRARPDGKAQLAALEAAEAEAKRSIEHVARLIEEGGHQRAAHLSHLSILGARRLQQRTLGRGWRQWVDGYTQALRRARLCLSLRTGLDKANVEGSR